MPKYGNMALNPLKNKIFGFTHNRICAQGLCGPIYAKKPFLEILSARMRAKLKIRSVITQSCVRARCESFVCFACTKILVIV